MFNVFLKLACTLSILCFALWHCSKVEYIGKIDEGVEVVPLSAEDRSQPPLQLVNGRLKFQDFSHFWAVRADIEGANPDSIQAWQESIGFQSSMYHYKKALEALCCEDYDVSYWQQKKQEYQGKATIDTDNFEVSPLTGGSQTTGWIANAAGEFLIGNVLCKVSPSHTFSILDGDALKLANAQTTLQSNPSIGVFVSPIVSSMPAIGCSTVLFPPVNNGNSVGSQRIKEAVSYDLMEHFVGQGLEGPIPIAMYTHVLAAHHQKKSIFGWSICDRTRWAFASTTQITISGIPTSPTSIATVGFSSPVRITRSVSATSGEVCKFRDERNYLTINNISFEQASNIVRCYSRNDATVTALKSGLTTSATCSTICPN